MQIASATSPNSTPPNMPAIIRAGKRNSTPGGGPNEHFYTADATECAKVRADPLWQQEGIAFRASPPASGACAAGRASVVRLWRPGDDAQASRHRYLVDAAEIARMAAAGWIVEGPVFCPPA